jgi:hypothetical protein
VLDRARTWVDEQVPCSQVRWWSDANGWYRQDCSGYVSMAWHLDQNTDYWTGNLHTVSHAIPVDELQPGDILLSSTHTLLFAGWLTKTDRMHFALYEEYATGFTAHYVRGASIDEYLDKGFIPYRYNGIITGDEPVPQIAENTPDAIAPLPPVPPQSSAAPRRPRHLLRRPRRLPPRARPSGSGRSGRPSPS